MAIVGRMVHEYTRVRDKCRIGNSVLVSRFAVQDDIACEVFANLVHRPVLPPPLGILLPEQQELLAGAG